MTYENITLPISENVYSTFFGLKRKQTRKPTSIDWLMKLRKES